MPGNWSRNRNSVSATITAAFRARTAITGAAGFVVNSIQAMFRPVRWPNNDNMCNSAFCWGEIAILLYISPQRPNVYAAALYRWIGLIYRCVNIADVAKNQFNVPDGFNNTTENLNG